MTFNQDSRGFVTILWTYAAIAMICNYIHPDFLIGGVVKNILDIDLPRTLSCLYRIFIWINLYTFTLLSLFTYKGDTARATHQIVHNTAQCSL